MASTVGAWLALTSKVSSPPAARGFGTMVYDAADGYVLLFGGGYGSTTYVASDTWTYQRGVWTDISGLQTFSPAGRYTAAMAYDAADHEVVLFGGQFISPTKTTVYSDTWTFSGGQWTNITLTAGTPPAARWRANMAYDGADGYVLLFSGTDVSSGVFTDTWKFVGGSWTKLTVTGSPPGRYRAVMAYDAFDKEVIIFGGTVAGVSDSTTWAYKNLAWSQVTGSAHPSARVYFQMTYDPSYNGIILFGGSPSSSTGVAMSDTWLFTGGVWANITTAVAGAPQKRGYEVMAYDPDGNYTVLFGGWNNTGATAFYSDTWSFGPYIVAWMAATPSTFDHGQSTSLNITAVSKSANLTYQYFSLPAGCTSANLTPLVCAPTGAGTFTVRGNVSDATFDNGSSNVTLIVHPSPTVPSITLSPPQVEVGIVSHFTAVVAGGTSPFSYAWPVLPSGCSSSNTAVLTCSANKTGLWPVNVTATDHLGEKATGTATFVVNPAPSIGLFIASPSKIDLGQTSTLIANVSGGTAPFSYYWFNLPLGCFNQNISMLPCHPLGVATTLLNVTVNDTFGLQVKGTITLQVSVPLNLVSSAVSPKGTDSGIKVTFYLNASLGTAPYTYTFAGLPQGCVLASKPISSCVPHDTGTFLVMGTVTDAAGASVSKTFTLMLLADPVITAVNLTPAVLDVGADLSVTTEASLGNGVYTFAYSGLPPGCQGNTNQGFTCHPTGNGHFLVQATVTDGWGKTASGNASLTIGKKLAVASFAATPAPVAPGSQLTFNVTMAGGVPPYAYRYTGLPTGCASASTASLKCTPSATGTYKVEVIAGDQAQGTAISIVNVTVQSPGGGTSLSLTSPIGLGILAAVAVVVIASALLLVRRRRRAREEPPAEEA